MTTLTQLLIDNGLLAKEDMGADMALYQAITEQSRDDVNLSDIDSDVENLNDLMRAYTEVSHIGAVINSAAQTGVSITTDTVKMTGIAVEAIFSRLNMKVSDHLLPSLESFTDSKRSLTATRISVENIVDHVKRIASTLAKVIKRIWKAVKEFLAKVFSRNKAIVDNIKSLLKDVDSLPNDIHVDHGKLMVATEDYNTVTPLMRRLPFGINGRCTFETVKTITEVTKILLEGNRDIIGSMVNCLKSVSDEVESDVVRDEADRLVKEIKSKVSRLKLKSKKIDGPRELYTYGYFISGQICEVEEFIAKIHVNENVTFFNIRVRMIQEAMETFTPELLRPNEMAIIGKMAIDLMRSSKELENNIPVISMTLEKNIAYLEDKLANIDFDPTGENGKFTITNNIVFVEDLFRYITGNLPKLNSDASKTAISIGYYIKDCVEILKNSIKEKG